MKTYLKVALALAGCFIASNNAQATFDLVTFEDDNVAAYNEYIWTGWNAGSDSENKFVVPSGAQASITRKDGLTFNFDYASFASVIGGDSSVTITGYKAGAVVGGAVTFSSLTPTFTQYYPIFPPAIIEGVDTLVFTGSNWRMDNFKDLPSTVPEPSTVIAGALLLLPFGISALRIVRQTRS